MVITIGSSAKNVVLYSNCIRCEYPVFASMVNFCCPWRYPFQRYFSNRLYKCLFIFAEMGHCHVETPLCLPVCGNLNYEKVYHTRSCFMTAVHVTEQRLRGRP